MSGNMDRKKFARGRRSVTDVAAPGTSRVPKGARRELRFRDLVESALEAKRLRGNEPSSLASDRWRLRRVLPILGHVKVGALTGGRIELFLQSLARGDALHDPVRGATVNRYHSLLQSIFRYAMRQGLVRVNPLAGGSVERSKESPIIPRYLGRDEQRRLLRVIRQECPKKALELELAILSGMRRGEQFNAKWEEWKIGEGVLLVHGKTGDRAVQVNQAARRCLTRLKKRAPDAIFITPERNESPRDSRLWFEHAVKDAGLAPGLHWHSLRHTFCSRHVAAGTPLLTVQKLAGHRSFQTTLRYSHLSPGDLKRAAEKVEF